MSLSSSNADLPGVHLNSVVNAPHQFSYESGVLVTRVEPGFAQGVLEVGPNSINPHGKVHGGALATLADTVGGCCASSSGLAGKSGTVTSGSTMEFLRPADGPRIFCTATPKKMGYHLSVIQVELTNVSGETVATGTFTFFMSHS